MKRYFWMICFLLICATAWAGSSLEVAYETSSYVYEEPDGNMPIKLKGVLQGANAVFKHTLQDNNLFWVADFRYMGGATDYDGWLQTSPPTKHTTDDIGDYYLEGRFHVGQVYTLSETTEIWGSIGLGYRYLKDHSNKSDYGYLRESQYIYFPCVLDVKWYLADGWKTDLNLEVDFLFRGQQTSRMSTYDPSYNDPKNTQDNGFGLRAGIKITKDFGNIGLFIEPFWRYWEIQDSQTAPLYKYGMLDSYIIEPHNTTHELGLRAGFYF